MSATPAETGTISLHLSSREAAPFLILQSSSDLQSWQRLGPVELKQGAASTTERSSAQHRFFRAFPETPPEVIAFFDRQARDLAQVWFEHRNRTEGIEAVGGPFTLSNFTSEATAYTNFGYLNLSFRSIDPRQQIGRPFYFQTFSSQVRSPKAEEFPIYFGAFPRAGLSETDLQEVQSQIGSNTFFLATHTILEIDSGGTILSSNRMYFLPVVSVRNLGRELVVDAGDIESSELRRRTILMEEVGNHWRVSDQGRACMDPERFASRLQDQNLTVIVVGELDAGEITNVVGEVETSFGRLPALVYLRRTSFLTLDPDVHLVEPRKRFIFYRVDDHWRLRHTITLTYSDTLPFFKPVLPLLPRPEPAEVDHVLIEIGELQLPVSEADLRYFIETTLRVRGIDHRIVDIRRIGNEVQVWTGEIFGPLAGGGDMVIFRKLGDRWIISTIGHWVS